MNKQDTQKWLFGGVGLAIGLIVAVIATVSLQAQNAALQGYLALKPASQLTVDPKATNGLVAPKLNIDPVGVGLMYGEVPPPSVQIETRGRLMADTVNQMMKVGMIKTMPTDKGCFADVKGHQYENAICWMVNQKYIAGYPDNTFRPNDGVNRAEGAKFFWGIFVKTFNTTGAPLYPDVPSDAWFANYVNSLANYNKVDVKPLYGARYFPGYTMTVLRTSYWLQNFGTPIVKLPPAGVKLQLNK